MYRKSARGWEKHLDFMIWDQLSLQIAFLLAYMLRNGLSNPYSHLIYCNVAFILVVIREFDTSKLKRILQSLETGLFFCQIFVFII